MHRSEPFNREAEILRAFDLKREAYDQLGAKVAALLHQLLSDNNIGVHSVVCRVKNRDRLREKLARPDKQYAHLSEITDIAGIRVITYFSEDVERVSQVIERELDIDSENTIDKRLADDPNRFGYVSMHFVCSMDDRRTGLPEYARFAGLKCEIQVRSILQHAWAEIEHDLGYKTEVAVPQTIRRRFARLSGILELADEEFDGIRRELEDYELCVPQLLNDLSTDVTIDAVSVRAYVSKDTLVQQLDAMIATEMERVIIQPAPEFVEKLTSIADIVGIRTIAELGKRLSRSQEAILTFRRLMHRKERSKSTSETLYQGICIFYLGYVECSADGDLYKIEAYLDALNIAHGAERMEFAETLLSVHEEFVSTSGQR